MRNKSALQSLLTIALFSVLAIIFFLNKQTLQVQKTQATSPIQHVFIIAMENHDWSAVVGNSSPYITKTLLPMGGHANQYYNPPGNHPSAPNYVWLEAGAAVAGKSDCAPTSASCRSSATHLSMLLDSAGISWKEYAEDATGKSCIIDFSNVDVNHVPFSYFNDVTNNGSANSTKCIAHERPYTEFATDLQNNSVPRYSFITPNLNNDMHNGTVQQGDTWLSHEVPKILNSQAYKTDGVLFIVWDEGEGNDGPIGMIVLSPFAKKNYSNNIHYDHSSMLKTLEEIFGVSPMLGGAAKATDLSDFFTGSITSGGSGNTPTPSEITPTLFCLGSCKVSPSPSTGVSQNPSVSPSTTISGSPAPSTSVTPGPKPCKSDNDKDNDSKSNAKCNSHHTKGHHHKKGAISNALLQLLQELIALLNQLLGGKIPPITIPGNLTPTPSVTIIPETSGTISPGPSSAPMTNLHYTSNSNFQNGTYAPGTVGFNLADVSSVSEVDNLPSNVKALVYLNLCNGADATFTSTVQPYIGKTNVFGFYLIDEPDPTGEFKALCPAANLKAESDWIHTNDPGAKTFIIEMNMSSSNTPNFMNTYNPANSDIDLYGIDGYPCRTDVNGCDFSIITKHVQAAEAAGIPQAAIVPVYQAFGGGTWKTDGGGSYILPTAAQEKQILSTWQSVIPNPVFDYAYSWGTQNGDQSLSGSSTLQQVFATHNQ